MKDIVTVRIPKKEIETFLKYFCVYDYYLRTGSRYELQDNGSYGYTKNKEARRLDAFVKRLEKALKD